jgi:polyhydroxyalkanoate synthesis regulator phasin
MEKIEDLFKKFLFTGVGMAAMAKDKLEKTIEEFVEKNKMSTEEGERIIKEFKESTQIKTKELKDTISKLLEKAKTGFKFANQSELEELKYRIKELEDQLDNKKKK